MPKPLRYSFLLLLLLLFVSENKFDFHPACAEYFVGTDTWQDVTPILYETKDLNMRKQGNMSLSGGTKAIGIVRHMP